MASVDMGAPSRIGCLMSRYPVPPRPIDRSAEIWTTPVPGGTLSRPVTCHTPLGDLVNRTRLAALLTALVAALALLAPPAAAQRSMPDEAGRAAGWYLALGDSLATGYQPDRGDDPQGGYVGRVLDDLRDRDNKLHLRNVACSGETVVTMLDGGRCDYPRGSQLDQALHFLDAHGRSTELITVTIGANDVQRCVTRSPGGPMEVDMACVQQGLATVAQRLPVALEALRAAAPDAQIVVTSYYNPFLAAWFGDPGLAQLSAGLQDLLNGAIAAAAAGVDAQVADVAGAFSSDTWAPAPGSAVPTNVAVICAWTWMCSRTDIHANDQGYAAIAQAVVARVQRAALVG